MWESQSDKSIIGDIFSANRSNKSSVADFPTILSYFCYVMIRDE